jgi:hypothetical protein
MFDKMRAKTEEQREELYREAIEFGYEIDVTENIATAGFGTTRDFKYRWTIKRASNGVPVRTGYGMSIWLAHRNAEMVLKRVIKRDKRRAAKK